MTWPGIVLPVTDLVNTVDIPLALPAHVPPLHPQASLFCHRATAYAVAVTCHALPLPPSSAEIRLIAQTQLRYHIP